MRYFYQQNMDGWNLPPHEYACTVHKMRCYNSYKEKVNKISNMSEQNITNKDIDEKLTLEGYIKAIEGGLDYVPEEYKEAVFEHGVNGMYYVVLATQYHTSERTLKRYFQRFVYGVATNLGWVFDN